MNKWSFLIFIFTSSQYYNFILKYFLVNTQYHNISPIKGYKYH